MWRIEALVFRIYPVEYDSQKLKINVMLIPHGKGASMWFYFFTKSYIPNPNKTLRENLEL